MITNNLRWLPRVLRPRASWALVWREILNPREVHAKNKTKMASLFRNIVRLKLTKLLEARNSGIFVCLGRCFGKIRNITRVASVFSTESVNYRKRVSVLAAANFNDK